jgi:hypothetical protein
MSPDEVHAFLLAAAARLSPALCDALAGTGPLWFPEREDRGVPLLLARAIVGQQLSAKAARRIWARLEAAAAGAPCRQRSSAPKMPRRCVPAASRATR